MQLPGGAVTEARSGGVHEATGGEEREVHLPLLTSPYWTVPRLRTTHLLLAIHPSKYMPSPLARLAPTAFAVSILEHHSCALRRERKTQWHQSTASFKAVTEARSGGVHEATGGEKREVPLPLLTGPYWTVPRLRTTHLLLAIHPNKYMPSPLARLAPTAFAVSILEHHSCALCREKKNPWHQSTASFKAVTEACSGGVHEACTKLAEMRREKFHYRPSPDRAPS